VTRQDVGDEAVGEAVLMLQQASHGLPLHRHDGARLDGDGGPVAEGLAGQAAFAEEVSGPQNGNDRLSANRRLRGHFDAARPDIEDVLARVALREDRVPLPVAHDGPLASRPFEKGRGTEGRRLWRYGSDVRSSPGHG